MSWFSRKCPVDEETREWIDTAFKWLIDELGINTLRAVKIVLPIEESFPDPYDGSIDSIRAMFEKVCYYMDVDSNLIRLSFYRNEESGDIHPLASREHGSHALGTYHMGADGQYHIRLDTSQSSAPEAFIATMAHELGHVVLLGEGRLDPDHPDHEPMTDLVVIFYGMGIFSSNSVFSFRQFTNTYTQGWSAERRGYLTEEMCGYALALFARARNEDGPAWSSYLNYNVRTYLKHSLKWLADNDDYFGQISPV